MNKVERVKKAFKGEPVDKVPVSMWFHFPKEKWYGDEYVKAHMDYYKASNIDFIKMMNDAFFPYPLETIRQPSDWRNIRPFGRNSDFVQKQAEHAARLNEALKGECLTFWTVLSPFSDMRFSAGDPMVTNHLKEDPESVIEGMKALAQDAIDVAELCITKGGCAGIYFGYHSADKGRFTREQYDSYIRPYDFLVAEAFNKLSSMNIGHLCGWAGIQNNLDWWMDYPVQVMNWAPHVEEVKWEDGADYFKNVTRMGGFDNREEGLLYSGTKEEIQQETKRLLEVSGKQGVIIGADCTLPMDIEYERIRWVVDACEEA